VTTSAIVGPKLLFLGAGASKPYGKPLMGEFIHSFREKIEGPTVLLDAICEKHEDLEFLIQELEALSTRDYLEKESFDPNPPGSGPFGQQWRWPDFQKLAIEARELLARLKKEVYLEYRSIPDPAQTSILEQPIKLLKTDSYPMVVFTTNYDPAVEDFCEIHGYGLTDGFEAIGRQDVWDRKHFYSFDKHDPAIAKALEPSVVLFKLHGSANWFKSKGKIILSSPMYTNDPDYPNVMIYPATNKVAKDEPFFTAYDYLQRLLDKAESCLAIGYSFRDYDTLMRFKSAKLSNPDLKIAVLDPNAEALCEFLSGHGISAHAIPYAFGSEQLSMYLPLIAELT
jgi:hypothetical protein